MTDEQLPGAEGEGVTAAGDEPEEIDEPREWPARQHPMGVRLTGAAMRGLHRALYGAQDDDIVVVADASGDPPWPDGMDLHLDPDHPEASTVVVRGRSGKTARAGEASTVSEATAASETNRETAGGAGEGGR